MSVLTPEGTPKPVAAEAAPESAPTGLRASHVAGGGFGGVVGAAAAAVLNHYGVHVSDLDAALLGSAALAAGTGLGHVVGKVGVVGAVKLLWRGRS